MVRRRSCAQTLIAVASCFLHVIAVAAAEGNDETTSTSAEGVNSTSRAAWLAASLACGAILLLVAADRPALW
ncbi:hypothetical protein NFJ02_02g74510 [Pycnococcus provasolii]